ncbi:hypothetical protein A7U60_g986 [Sanghuangporus baumii]|uniref:Uncharacterized protein n=1 Tax=Sanghuangporus baumii TaxID=108892 RepID=A0A9Q5NBL5_SANBA|nr:hypothetical protein A7U60_g986 [Sanghuangporus baumii]
MLTQVFTGLKSESFNIQKLASKYHGSHGDHAEDQKAKHQLLASWKEKMTHLALGSHRFFLLTQEERDAFVLEAKKKMIEDLGGESDNAAILELAEEDNDAKREETAAEKRATEVSKAGGVKLSSLMRMLLNDKDDKKGWHHIFRDWAKKHLKIMFTFPDTLNTRYSLYLDAATKILAHLSSYLEFMDSICYSKDAATLTELAYLALYYEVVSVDYIASIRGKSIEEVNALGLGSRLEQVKHHLQTLLDSPQIILSSQAQPEEATLDGNKTWNRPDAIEAIQNLITEGRLLKLEALFRAFLMGALSTWEQFSSEFSDDSIISALIKEEKELAWIPTTNDANERALGSYRVHAEDTKRLDRKRWHEVTAERDQEQVAKKIKCDLQMQKKMEREVRIESASLELDSLNAEQMTLPEIKLQLAKFRKIYRNDIPADKTMSKKAKKQAVLLVLIDRYNSKHPPEPDKKNE